MPIQNNALPEQTIDLSGVETHLNSAGESIADGLDDLFKQFSETLLDALQETLSTGEFDFRSVLSSIFGDLAQFAIDQIFSSASSDSSPGVGILSPVTEQNPSSVPMNVTVNMASGGGADNALGSVNQIAAAVAQATLRGSRFL